MRSSGDTFELRVNRSSMDVDEAERPVIFRYRVTGDQVVRVQPIAANARGFVEEWLEMPWVEAQAQTAPEASEALRPVYEEFHPPPLFTIWRNINNSIVTSSSMPKSDPDDPPNSNHPSEIQKNTSKQ